MRVWMLVGVSLLLTRCATMELGEKVDLGEIATPDNVKETAALKAPAQPVLPAYATPGTFKLWKPRAVSANGDVVEGHFVEVSAQEAKEEVVPYEKFIPRAPKNSPRIVQSSRKAGRTEPPVTPEPPLPVPTPPSQGSMPGYPPSSALPPGYGLPGMGGAYAP